MGPGSALFTVLLFVFVGYEAIRFRELWQTCIRTHEENERLLTNVLCADAWQRTLHGPKQEELCRVAREENDRTPEECAWRLLWMDGELHQLWVRVSTSYWLLFGLGAPALCTAVAMWFSNRNQAAARRDQRALFEDMAKALRPPPPPPPTPIPADEDRGLIHEWSARDPPPRRLSSNPSWHYEERHRYLKRRLQEEDEVDLVRI